MKFVLIFAMWFVTAAVFGETFWDFDDGKKNAMPDAESQTDCLFVPIRGSRDGVKYTLCVYPKEIQYGDTVYFCVLRENPSEESLPIRAEMFAFAQNVRCSWKDAPDGESVSLLTEQRFFEADGGEEWNFSGNMNFNQQQLNGIYPLLPKSWGVIAAFEREFPALEDFPETFWKKEEGTLEIVVSEGGDAPQLVSEPFPIHVRSRCASETALLNQWLAALPANRFPTVKQTSCLLVPCTGVCGTCWRPDPKDVRTYDVKSTTDAPHILYNPLVCLMNFESRKPDYTQAPESAKEWLELENRFSESTLKDEIRFLRFSSEFLELGGQTLRYDQETTWIDWEKWLWTRPFPQKYSICLRLMRWSPRILSRMRSIASSRLNENWEERKKLTQCCWEWEEQLLKMESRFNECSTFVRKNTMQESISQKDSEKEKAAEKQQAAERQKEKDSEEISKRTAEMCKKSGCRPGLEPYRVLIANVEEPVTDFYPSNWDECKKKVAEIQRQKQWLEVTPGAIRVGESVTVRRYAENESSVPFSVTKSGKPAVLTCLLEEKYAIQIPQKEPVQPSDDVKLTIAPGETVLVGEYVFQVPKPEDSASPFWEFIRENVSKEPIVCRLFLGETQTRGVDLTFSSAPPPPKNEKFREIRENALNE